MLPYRSIRKLRLIAIAAVLALLTSPLVIIGAGARPAFASAPAPAPATASGEIVAVSGTGCLDSSLALVSCNGNFGAQLWTMEADGTIRIWGYDSYNGSTWNPSAQKCLNVPTKAQNGNQTSPITLVGLPACDRSQVDSGGNPTDTWNVHPVSGQTYGLLYNPYSNRCLTTDIKMASCSQTNTSEQWKLPTETNAAVHQAASAVLGLQAMYDQSSGLFEDSFTQPCQPRSDGTYGGNCWWWSANALYALIDFLENSESNGSWTGDGAILADIGNTYSKFCGSNGCPASANNQSMVTLFQNPYFDDTGNWALAWLNAYELSVERNQVNSANPVENKYLYLAENLWYYITNKGWDGGGNPWTCADPGGIVQHLPTSDKPQPDKNLGSNALYLLLSSWLYRATGLTRYLKGPDGTSTDGGATAEANWLIGTAGDPGPLIQHYSPSPAFDQPGSRILLDGQMDPYSNPGTCTIATGQPKETQHMGQVIAALASMYRATGNSFYLTVGDNVAETVMNDNSANWYTSPAEPMIDANGVLSEDCTPLAGAGPWPDGCDVTGSANVWLPGKGIFMRGLYCLASALQGSDAAVPAFITSNAQWVWAADQNTETGNPAAQNLSQFGFLWDKFHGGSGSGQGFATQGAAVEALSANLGLATSMC